MKYVFIIEGTAPAESTQELTLMGKSLVSHLRQEGHEITVAAIKFPGNTGDKVDLLAVKGTVEEAEQFGILADILLKNLLGKLTFAFDPKKLIKHPEFKKGIHSFAIAAKDAASLPADLDDVVIDQIVMLLDGIIDQQQLSGPIEVGATPDQMARPRLKRYHTREEVLEAIRQAGGDPSDTRKFSPAILLLLQYLPTLIDFIMKLINKQ